jgi:lipoate-protein ligase A
VQLLDHTFPTPAENLAYDEALLEWAESGLGGETLRFWEPRECFVVVGYADQIAREVNVRACEAERVPILRRCSGGGTVLQGPGCLNYTLVLLAEPGSPLASITGANQFIMERNRAAVERLLGLPVRIQGHTDLTLAGRKFSGNAQRRRRHCLLFHGTFLLRFDLPRLARLLAAPSREPAYRVGRPHLEFVTNLGVEASSLKTAIQAAWGDPSPPSATLPPAPDADLTAKYSDPDWNGRL